MIAPVIAHFGGKSPATFFALGQQEVVAGENTDEQGLHPGQVVGFGPEYPTLNPCKKPSFQAHRRPLIPGDQPEPFAGRVIPAGISVQGRIGQKLLAQVFAFLSVQGSGNAASEP